jgi:hypothetical protein
MVTLTYPAEFPIDGKLVKRQFEALCKRWLRQWGERPRGMWVIEFQDRGAPHFHMICGAPKGIEDRELRDWGFNTWTAYIEFRRLVRSLRGPGDSHAERKALRVRLYDAMSPDLRRGEDMEEVTAARRTWNKDRMGSEPARAGVEGPT